MDEIQRFIEGKGYTLNIYYDCLDIINKIQELESDMEMPELSPPELVAKDINKPTKEEVQIYIDFLNLYEHKWSRFYKQLEASREYKNYTYYIRQFFRTNFPSINIDLVDSAIVFAYKCDPKSSYSERFEEVFKLILFAIYNYG